MFEQLKKIWNIVKSDINHSKTKYTKEQLIEQLKRVLNIVELEINNANSKWTKEQLIKSVKPEIEELFKHFINGDVFFKYGKKQRMLVSTYIITESMENLSDTNLGKEIFILQDMYDMID